MIVDVGKIEFGLLHKWRGLVSAVGAESEGEARREFESYYEHCVDACREAKRNLAKMDTVNGEQATQPKT